jgi:pimeloyl-ACP methyl ester carboxylesterase
VHLTVDPWIGDGFRAVAPSRFGCLGSPLPPGATAADQADAYAVLLDALGIERAAVVGFSAGTRLGDAVRAPAPRPDHGAGPHVRPLSR